MLGRAACLAGAPALAALGASTRHAGAQTGATPVASTTGGELPSWTDGAVRRRIFDFVAAVTDEAGPDFVPPDQRIATFDLDGTLWVSHPIYVEVLFAYDRIRALAPEHPEWATQEPFATILAGANPEYSPQAAAMLVAAAHAGFTVAEFEATVAEWLATTRHPRFQRPYTELVYQPMREVMDLMRRHGFAVYVVSGSGQEFIRAFAGPVLGVPPERVIGSASQVTYEVRDGEPVLVMQPEMIFVDDHGGKPEGINLVVGRRPIAAFGNSDGDREMLEWTEDGPGARLMALVHHDDAEREYAYGPDTTVGTFSDALMAEAAARDWIVISMERDWTRIFAG
ncbi:MAG: haloacid dehalogenase-like hydrolase [Chloroflexia bacterium]|nr:haloacid dehalogenase-like hydrolase [Chloroflexia bacterium]